MYSLLVLGAFTSMVAAWPFFPFPFDHNSAFPNDCTTYITRPPARCSSLPTHCVVSACAGLRTAHAKCPNPACPTTATKIITGPCARCPAECTPVYTTISATDCAKPSPTTDGLSHHHHHNNHTESNFTLPIMTPPTRTVPHHLADRAAHAEEPDCTAAHPNENDDEGEAEHDLDVHQNEGRAARGGRQRFPHLRQPHACHHNGSDTNATRTSHHNATRTSHGGPTFTADPASRPPFQKPTFSFYLPFPFPKTTPTPSGAVCPTVHVARTATVQALFCPRLEGCKLHGACEQQSTTTVSCLGRCTTETTVTASCATTCNPGCTTNVRTVTTGCVGPVETGFPFGRLGGGDA